MSDERSPDDGLTRFEAQLAALAPATRLDRDRLLFAAGERSAARRARRRNRLLLGGNVGLAALLALALVSRAPQQPSADLAPSPSLVAQTPVVPAPESAALANAGPYAQFRLRQAWERGDWPAEASSNGALSLPDDEPMTSGASRRELSRLLEEQTL